MSAPGPGVRVAFRVAFRAAALLAFIALPQPAGAADWFPRGLTPVQTGSAAVSAKTCSACHAGIHAQWAQSRHALAWTNAIFQREYSRNRLEWCVHCHAPLPEQLAEVRAGSGVTALASEGVSCAACHIRDGRMQGRRRAEASPHDTVARADFGGTKFCGGCHQFNFPVVEPGADGEPGRVLGYTAVPMQDTEGQHARGPRAREECLSCHRDDSVTGGGHRFPGGHAPEFVRRALEVRTCRSQQDLEIVLANVGAGHNVPTGDLHRHLVLRAWHPDRPEQLAEVVMGRRFASIPGGGKRPVSDTTIRAGEIRRVHFPVAALGGERAAPIRVELRLVFTIDEFPFRGNEVPAPTWTTLFEDELSWPALPRCAARRAPGASESRASARRAHLPTRSVTSRRVYD